MGFLPGWASTANSRSRGGSSRSGLDFHTGLEVGHVEGWEHIGDIALTGGCVIVPVAEKVSGKFPELHVRGSRGTGGGGRDRFSGDFVSGVVERRSRQILV